MRKSIILLSTLLILSIISCTNDEPEIQIDNPTVYDFSRDGETTVSFTDQSILIRMADEMTAAMLDFTSSAGLFYEMFMNKEIGGEPADPFIDPTLNASELDIMSNVANSSNIISNQQSELIKEQFKYWLIEHDEKIIPSEFILAEPGLSGQIADGSTARYVNEKGMEYNQIVAKSLIGALMYDQICNQFLDTSVLDAGNNRKNNDQVILVPNQEYTLMEHAWDSAYGFLFGDVSNSVDPLTVLGEDNFLNKYLSRVEDDVDFAGIADEIWQAFKLGRAAIVASDYELRDEQAEIIKQNIADVIGIRAVYYLQNGKKALAGGDLGGAFHDLSEGFGFIYSLQFLRDETSSSQLFTSEEVDGYISQLSEGNGFWTLTEETLDQMSNSIAEKFDFTVAMAAE